jgi:hypothetical protein
VIDDEVNGHERLDDRGILTESRDCRAHGGEIHEKRDTSEILKNDTCDDEGNLFGPLGVGIPVGESANVVFLDLLSIEVAEHGFQDDANAHGKPGDRADTCVLKSWQGVELTGVFVAEFKLLECPKQIVWHVFSLEKPERAV